MNKNKFRRKASKGITLIALVITIIILLILAGISIAMLTGENGILTQANKAKTETEIAGFKEEVNVLLTGAKLERDTTDKESLQILKDAFQKDDSTSEIIQSNAVYEVKYKNQEFLVGNDFSYIEKVEPENKGDWEYTLNGKITKYNGTSENIVIPNYIDGVRIKEIANYLFQENETIKTIKISEGIENIGYAAFDKTKITDMVIPNSIIEMGSCAFQRCSSLEKVTFGSNIKRIGAYAFFSCTNLKERLDLPDTIEEIGFGAFWGCSKLEGELKKMPNLTKIAGCAFRECNKIKGSIIIPESMTEIEASTFQNCYELDGEIVIPDTIKTIKYAAFAGCSKLTGNLKLPANLEVMEGLVFSGCSNLTGNLVIPKGVKTIVGYTFFECGFDGILTIPNTLESIADETAFRNVNFSKIMIDNTEEKIPRNLFKAGLLIEYLK